MEWAKATARAIVLLQKCFLTLTQEECAEVAKPEWWNDEGLKALSARVVRAAPDDGAAHRVRAMVLSGLPAGAWEAGPRSAAELREAATHFDRAAALSAAPAMKAQNTGCAELQTRAASVHGACRGHGRGEVERAEAAGQNSSMCGSLCGYT